MPSVELSKVPGPAPARALSESERAQGSARPAALSATRAATNTESVPSSGVRIEIGAALETALDTATPPVDADRVAQIRTALREGTYPLVPTRIADALIAAQVSFAMPTKTLP